MLQENGPQSTRFISVAPLSAICSTPVTTAQQLQMHAMAQRRVRLEQGVGEDYQEPTACHTHDGHRFNTQTAPLGIASCSPDDSGHAHVCNVPYRSYMVREANRMGSWLLGCMASDLLDRFSAPYQGTRPGPRGAAKKGSKVAGFAATARYSVFGTRVSVSYARLERASVSHHRVGVPSMSRSGCRLPCTWQDLKSPSENPHGEETRPGGFSYPGHGHQRPATDP